MPKVAEIRQCKSCGNDFFYHLEKEHGICSRCGVKSAADV